MCESVSALPNAGGVLDQDALYIYYWKHVQAFDAERQKLNKERESHIKR